jgi:geranylgeranyl pyrophosphate synthase
MGQILTKISRVSTSLESITGDNQIKFELLEKALKETDDIILPVLKDLIKKFAEQSIWEQLEYSLINKAHFDRALFVKLGCEAVGGDYETILNAMASVELRYASGTAIDDVFDANDERMGKASMPEMYGQNPALSLGAILKSLSSMALLSNFETVKINPQSFIDIAFKDELTHYQVYLGQLADLKSEHLSIDEITDSYYLDMIKNSTGVDSGYCFELGCLLGGGSKEQQKAFYEFGVAVGTALQIRDDLLDYINNRDLINKEPFRDFETGKKRLPILIAYRFSSDKERNKIKELLKKGILQDEDKKFLAELINNEIVLGFIGKLKNDLLKTAQNNFNMVGANDSVKPIIEEIIQQIDG